MRGTVNLADPGINRRRTDEHKQHFTNHSLVVYQIENITWSLQPWS